MTSRDFGFLTLRNTRSYNLDDTYVPDNYVFTVSTYGAPKWTNDLILNNLVTSSIETSSIKISSLIDRDGVTGVAGEVLHTDGSQVYWGPQEGGGGYWSELANSTIYNNNTDGNVIVTSTLTAGVLSTNQISMLSTNSYISSVYTFIHASSLYYTPNDPTYIDAFKIELIGANFLVNRSTLGNISTTMLLNTGGGALSLGTNQPYVFIRGTNSGGNVGKVGIGTSTPTHLLEVAGNTFTNTFSTQTIYDVTGSPGTNNQFLTAGPSGSSVIWSSITANYWSLNGNNIYNNNNGGSGYVGIGTNTPLSVLDVRGNTSITGNLTVTDSVNSGYTSMNLINTSNVSSAVQFNMQNGGGAYSLYATDNEGSPAGSGLVPSTFQIYSYYPNPVNVLTIYPNGDMNVPGNFVANGSIISRLACSTINADPAGNWSNFYGKYCFVTLAGANLTIGGSPLDGQVIVIRNNATDNNLIHINGNAIAINKTLSFVYTTTSGITAGWYTL